MVGSPAIARSYDAAVEQWRQMQVYIRDAVGSDLPAIGALLRHADGEGASRDERPASLRDALGDEAPFSRIDIVRTQRPIGPWVRDRYLPFWKDGRRHLAAPAPQRLHPSEAGVGASSVRRSAACAPLSGAAPPSGCKAKAAMRSVSAVFSVRTKRVMAASSQET